MKKSLTVYLFLIFAFALAGCIIQTGKEPPSSSIGRERPSDVFQIVGTVTYQPIEGGFYAIDGDDGRKYDPLNLPEAFKEDGLKVKGLARLKKDVVGFHMYGEIIEIMDLEKQ